MKIKSQSKWTQALVMSVLLQGASSAAAYTTQADVRHLRLDVEEISKQLDEIETSADAEFDPERVANHLEMVARHLQSVRVLICDDCKEHAFIEPEYRGVAESCEKPARVSSSRSTQGYVQTMRKELQSMRDHLARMTNQNLPFKRDQLLRWYYRHVVSALDSARPQCQ